VAAGLLTASGLAGAAATPAATGLAVARRAIALLGAALRGSAAAQDVLAAVRVPVPPGAAAAVAGGAASASAAPPGARAGTAASGDGTAYPVSSWFVGRGAGAPAG